MESFLKWTKDFKIELKVLVFRWNGNKLNYSLLTNQINLFINYYAVLYWLFYRASQSL